MWGFTEKATTPASKGLVEVVAAKECLAKAVKELLRARVPALLALGEQTLPMMACKASASGISRVWRASATQKVMAQAYSGVAVV